MKREIKDVQEHQSYGRYRCLGEQTKTICHLSFYTKSLARMFFVKVIRLESNHVVTATFGVCANLFQSQYCVCL